MFLKGREKHVEKFVLFENACGICKKTVEIVIISVETANKRCETCRMCNKKLLKLIERL